MMYVPTESGDPWRVEADDVKMSRGVSHRNGEDPRTRALNTTPDTGFSILKNNTEGKSGKEKLA